MIGKLLGLGFGAALIDILPMILKKLDRHSIASAFIFHLTAPAVLYYWAVDLPFWLKGGALYFVLALPVIILAAKEDQKSVPIITANTILLGVLVSYIQTFL